MVSFLFQQQLHFPFLDYNQRTIHSEVINLLERARILKMTPLQHSAIPLRLLPTQVTATPLMKQPDPAGQLGWDQWWCWRTARRRQGIDRRRGWGWEGTDVSREIILNHPDMNDVIKPRQCRKSIMMLVKTRSEIQIFSSPVAPLEIAFVELSHIETIPD